MKRLNRAITKQLAKYFFIIIISLTGLFLGKVLWTLPINLIYWGLGTGVAILVISLILDFLSVNDILPLLKN